MGQERAHAEFIGQGESLLIVGLGLRDIRRLTPRRNVTQKAQGIRLVTTFLVSTGERHRTFGEVVCRLQAAGQHMRLP